MKKWLYASIITAAIFGGGLVARAETLYSANPLSEVGYLGGCSSNCSAQSPMTQMVWSPFDDVVLSSVSIPLQRYFISGTEGEISLSWSTSTMAVEDIGNLASSTWSNETIVNCTPSLQTAANVNYPTISLSNAGEYATLSGSYTLFTCPVVANVADGESIKFSSYLGGGIDSKLVWYMNALSALSVSTAYDYSTGEPLIYAPSMAIYGETGTFINWGVEGSAFPDYSTSTYAFADPDFGLIGNAIRDVLKFLFVPSDVSLEYFSDARVDLSERIPFGYFAQASSTLLGLNGDTSTTSTFLTLYASTTNVHAAVPLFSMVDVENKIPVVVLTTIKTISGMLMWALFFMFIVSFASHDPLSHRGIKAPPPDEDYSWEDPDTDWEEMLS